MKKRLEAELISIAHRVLKLKNKSEVDQLYLETKKLYEVLAVLKFYGDNFEQVKSSVSEKKLEAKIIATLDSSIDEIVENDEIVAIETTEAESIKNSEIVEEEKTESAELIEENNLEIEEETVEAKEEIVIENEVVEAVIEDEKPEEITILEAETEVGIEAEKSQEIIDYKEESIFKPIFEFTPDEVIPESMVEPEILSEPEILKPDPSNSEQAKQTKQISFDELLGGNYVDPVFVKPSDNFITKSSSLNEKLSAGINIGLNDRIGFVNNLFGASNEDFNRVVSQLSTIESYSEAKKFINEMVKPDYNNWTGKEDYAERFMEIVEKKFI